MSNDRPAGEAELVIKEGVMMKTENKIIVGTYFFAVLISLVTLAARIPTTWTKGSFAFHWPLFMNVAGVLLNMGAAALFLLGTRAYKDQLRKAYTMIAISVVLLALGTMQLPILDSYDLWNSWWVTGGWIVIPFILVGLVGYFGIRSLAKLVGVKSIFTNIAIVFGGAIVVSFLVTLLPHTSNVTTSNTAYEASNFLSTWLALTYFAMLLLAIRIGNHVGQHYKEAMMALALALLAGTAILSLVVANALITNNTHSIMYTVVNVLTLLAGFAWLRAGYLFAKTKEY